MKKIIATEKAPAAIGPYSQATQAGNMVFVSGQLPVDPQTGAFPGDDIQLQAKQSLQNLQVVLDKVEIGLENVLKTTVFLTDIQDFQAFNEVYADFFHKDCPARSCIQVAALPKGARLEIEAIAVRG